MSRRGAVMLETLISMTLFIGAAAFALVASRSVLTALDRARYEQEAIDLARTRMAELEAGLINLSELRQSAAGGAGSFEEPAGPGQSRGIEWAIDVNTERTPYGDLTLVELSVRETPERPGAIGFVLRQLVRLRAADVEEYEQDDLLRNLPLEPQ